MKLYDQWGTFMLWLNRKKEQIRKIIIDFKQIKTVSEFFRLFFDRVTQSDCNHFCDGLEFKFNFTDDFKFIFMIVAQFFIYV